MKRVSYTIQDDRQSRIRNIPLAEMVQGCIDKGVEYMHNDGGSELKIVSTNTNTIPISNDWAWAYVVVVITYYVPDDYTGASLSRE